MGFNWPDIVRGAADTLLPGAGIPLEAYNELSGGEVYGPNSTVSSGLDYYLGQKGPPNPANSAMKYLDQIPGQLKDIFNPYMQQGQEAYGTLNNAYSSMAKDPAAYLENIMKGYKPSASYQNKFNEMSRAAGNTAAAGGMRGSMQDIQNNAHIADSLMGEDMQEWLKNVMGAQGRGLQGLGNFYDTGYNAAQGYGSDLSNVMNEKASLAFQGQANQNQATADQRNMWLQAASSILGPAAGAAVKKWA